MKGYQVVLVDGDGASFIDYPTTKVFMDKEKAELLKEELLEEDVGWWDVYVKEVEIVE